MSPAITLCRGHLPYRRPGWRAPHSRAYPRSGHPRSTDHEYSTTRPQTDPVMSDAITTGGHLLVLGHTVCTSTRQPKLKLIGTKPETHWDEARRGAHSRHYVSVVLDVPSVTSVTNI